MLNKVIIAGRCGNDPEKRMTGSGTPVTTVNLAVDRDFADKSTGKKETDWITVVAWREQANFLADYFQKGRVAIVVGRLQMRSYNDRDGNKRTVAEVVAEHIYFGDSKKDGTEGHAQPDSGYSAPSYFTPPAKPAEDFQVLEYDDTLLPF